MQIDRRQGLPPSPPAAAAALVRRAAPYGAGKLARQALQVLPRGRHRGRRPERGV